MYAFCAWQVTTHYPSSLVEESAIIAMDDATTNSSARLKRNSHRAGASRKTKAGDGSGDEECDVEAWDMLSKSFKQAQTVLDQNRDLIQQVNVNHKSKIPDNLPKNVSLIRDINGNISRVMSIYPDLSVNFSTVVQERRRLKNGETSNGESNAD